MYNIYTKTKKDEKMKVFFLASILLPIVIQLIMLYTLPVWGTILGIVILGVLGAGFAAGQGSGALALIPMILSYWVGVIIVAAKLFLP